MKATVFCTKCQKDNEHSFTIDHNNELVFSCGCGCFIKIPALSPLEIKAALDAHKKENQGRELLDPVKEAKKAAAKNDYLKALADAGIVK